MKEFINASQGGGNQSIDYGRALLDEMKHGQWGPFPPPGGNGVPASIEPRSQPQPRRQSVRAK